MVSTDKISGHVVMWPEDEPYEETTTQRLFQDHLSHCFCSSFKADILQDFFSPPL